jgi:FKBP-type peptidyl-prolyl cis-trans isomerase SlyD
MADFIRAAYTGKIKDTGKIFDTTDEDVAKKNGIYGENVRYGPIPIILGEGRVIKGLENVFLKMKAKDKKTIEISPDEGFGRRSAELVKLVPLNAFKGTGIDPRPGMTITLDGIPAKVQSVSGGRVRVDFNHELADKTVVYEVELVEKITDNIEKAKALFEMCYSHVKEEPKISKKEDELEIKLPKSCTTLKDAQQRKIRFIEEVKKHTGFKRVKIEEEY